MTTQLQLPESQVAHEMIVGIHKQAFFGRLAQYGLEPSNQKEAAALLDLGVGLMQQSAQDGQEKAAAAEPGVDYGDGPFARMLSAFDSVQGPSGAPGFEGLGKQASSLSQSVPEPQLPQALVDSAYQTAYELAHDPGVYGAAIVKRAENEQLMFEYLKESGYVDEQGNPIGEAAATPQETPAS
jgi:hypothetical protein